ncbi:MAG TPA: hypothetical protein VEA80_02650 [Vitreimonas sp.]|uniref:hypothetical protein n=1 Tax=Vitreimonas sp. TaxID=3069702 RepID=UPI002D456726|nr:hypothetical protein [Vitreimonas sp.]HYD86351.1 hypothetical protein [Vitreimonas sp.]
MTRTFLLAGALLALAACQSAANLDEGERLAWRCAGDKEFSLRAVGDAIEVYAAGETNRLEPIAAESGRAFSNGEITYAEAGGRATLSGVHGGPYENCSRQRSDWWLDLW